MSRPEPLVSVTTLSRARPASVASPNSVTNVPGGYRELIIEPPGARGRILPVVIALHGRGGTGEEAVASYGLEPLAREKDFILVAPSAPGGVWHDVGSDRLQHRDLSYFDKLIRAVALHGGDPARIYVVGFSNGGGMAHVLASRFSDRLAAAAAGGASVGSLDLDLEYHGLTKPDRPIPMLLFHGMQDHVCGYDMSTFTVSAPDSARWWAQADGLTTNPTRTIVADGQVLIDHFGADSGPEVELISYKHLAHDWPGSQDQAIGFNFEEALWSFLGRHSLPAAGAPRAKARSVPSSARPALLRVSGWQ